MLSQKIKIPIYHGDLVLIQTNNFKKVSKKYKLTSLKGIGACAFPYPKKCGRTRYFIIVRNDVTPSVIAHEALHTVNSIMHDRWIKSDLDNDEPQAYLLGWIVKQCHKTFKITKEN